MKAARLLAENIVELLKRRQMSQHDLAQWCYHSDAWLSAILSGTRGVKLTELDRIADGLGVATYQLFQPGIARTTERRKSLDRRRARERRVGFQATHAAELEASVRPPPIPDRTLTAFRGDIERMMADLADIAKRIPPEAAHDTRGKKKGKG